MASDPSPEPKDQTAEAPAPEVLKPRADDGSEASEPSAQKAEPRQSRGFAPRRHQTYHPSHKATFIGLAVVVAILALNAGVIAFVLKSQSKSNSQASQGLVQVSQAALDKLGVNQSDVGDLGVQLVVNPNAKFNGSLTVGGDTSIGGELKLNSKFTANDASLAQLEAGKTSLSTLDVNGDSTVSNLNLRQDLLVTGTSRLQGPTVISQLLTVNNNANITGSLSVGGALNVNLLHVGSLVVDSSVTIGGHIITSGAAPAVSGGSALGSNGTVSISGNDQAGTVGVNIGVGAVGGQVASVSFHSRYATTPHVVVTPIGNVGTFYISRSSGGFNIYVGSGLSPGGYAFDYIVEQ